ncbi:hypothetical protein GSI_03242 [Ganoderma sinense ZZ0214-1]|uniref:F-box domain-containing protein n=1 Tax=Ganoderma sinense ZZ0214-1 TaxID=1077348 RepID=A0A2G8SL13_9APHY|nr:hypothetical protein GSI_03242 [Ganoderma sinense ZZ0214-1]
MTLKNKHIDALPVELLLEVFRYVVPPSRLLDPVSSRGTNSPWTRAMTAKATLAEVNRRWHSVSLGLLYEEACLRRPAQVRSLSDSLLEHPDRHHLLKTVIVDCPADAAEDRTVVFRGLAQILTRCTRLRTLIFTDALFSKDVKPKLQGLDLMFLFRDPHEICQYEIPTTLVVFIESALSRTLARFEHWPEGGTTFYTRHSMAWPLGRFTHSPHLTSLAIHIDNPAALDSIVLTSLEELDLSRDYVTPRDWDRSKYFLSWQLPRLRRLVLPVMTNIHERFLKRFGARITYLEFRDHLNLAPRYPWGPPTPPTDHIHLCPSLRHLVFQADVHTTSLPPLPAHATLAYIDVWLFSPAGRLRHDLLAARAGKMAERDVRLGNVRVLDRALHDIPGLAELFPPWTPAAELPSVHAIPGLSITHAPWGVYRSDLDELFPPAEAPWDEEPDSDEEYGEWDSWVLPGHSDDEEPEELKYDGSSEDEAGTATENDSEDSELDLLGLAEEGGDTEVDEEL